MKRSRFMHTFLLVICMCVLFSPLCTVYAAETVDHETDNNNTVDVADTMQLNIPIEGHLSDNSDVDWFKVETEKSGKLVFHFQHEADGVYSYCWYTDVQDSNGQSLNSGSLSGQEDTTFSVKATQAGTYYVMISAVHGGNPLMNGFSDAVYRITATEQCMEHPSTTDWVEIIPATCQQEGQRVQYCTVCNAVINEETMSITGHSYGGEIIIEEAAYFVSGKKEKVCTICGDSYSYKYITLATSLTTPVVFFGIILIIIIVKIIKKKREARRQKEREQRRLERQEQRRREREEERRKLAQNTSPSGSTATDYHSSHSSSSYNYEPVDYTPTYDDDPPYSGETVNYGGESYPVYTSDAEGYATDPYTYDSAGYKVSVDPDDILPPFDWADAGD